MGNKSNQLWSYILLQRDESGNVKVDNEWKLVVFVPQSEINKNICTFFISFLDYDIGRIVKYEYMWQGTRTNKDISAEFDYMTLDNVADIIACELNTRRVTTLKKTLEISSAIFQNDTTRQKLFLHNHGWLKKYIQDTLYGRFSQIHVANIT